MPSLSQIPLPVSDEQRVALQNDFHTGALHGASSRHATTEPCHALRVLPLLELLPMSVRACVVQLTTTYSIRRSTLHLRCGGARMKATHPACVPGFEHARCCLASRPFSPLCARTQRRHTPESAKELFATHPFATSGLVQQHRRKTPSGSTSHSMWRRRSCPSPLCSGTSPPASRYSPPASLRAPPPSTLVLHGVSEREPSIALRRKLIAALLAMRRAVLYIRAAGLVRCLNPSPGVSTDLCRRQSGRAAGRGLPPGSAHGARRRDRGWQVPGTVVCRAGGCHAQPSVPPLFSCVCNTRVHIVGEQIRVS